MITRRDAIGNVSRRCVLISSGALLLAPLAIGQTNKIYRVGWVVVTGESLMQPYIEIFFSAMRDLGYAPGRNLILDLRYADGNAGKLPVLVEEVLALKPDVLIGSDAIARIMKSKTSTIPIVLTNSSDPVATGLAQSLARPGGNVTGISSLWSEYVPKHLEIFREMLPRLSRVGMLVDMTAPGSKAGAEAAQRAAKSLGIVIISYPLASGADLDKALAKMEKDRLDALVIASGSSVLFNFRAKLLDSTLRMRIPQVSFVTAGEITALFAYGPNLQQAFRDAARFVDRILKGAKPADLPIEQPTRFELVVNLKIAKTLGIKVPQSILLRTDRVIE